MVSAISPSLKQAPIDRTIWGLDPLQLHMRYWAAHGVQVSPHVEDIEKRKADAAALEEDRARKAAERAAREAEEEAARTAEESGGDDRERSDRDRDDDSDSDDSDEEE